MRRLPVEHAAQLSNLDVREPGPRIRPRQRPQCLRGVLTALPQLPLRPRIPITTLTGYAEHGRVITSQAGYFMRTR